MTEMNTEYTFVNYEKACRTSLFSYLLALIGLASFFLATTAYFDIRLDRLFSSFGRLGHIIGKRMFPPDIEYATSEMVVMLLVQSIEMSVVGAALGFILVVPLAWFAAYNVTPGPKVLYLFGRASIVLARSIPSMMWGMILVTMFGFGPLAGVIALMIGSIGFAGKLMAEQVEAIDMQPIEALTSTGSNSLGVFIFGVIPQVSPAWAGIFVYNWDARLRSSTILGFVGAGGVGLALREQISTLNYHGALGIIMEIMLLVICSEFISVAVRKHFT